MISIFSTLNGHYFHEGEHLLSGENVGKVIHYGSTVESLKYVQMSIRSKMT